MSKVVHKRTEKPENTASSMDKTELTLSKELSKELSKGGRGGRDSGDLKEMPCP